MANPTSNVRLFEVNLIGDRVSTFFRRRTFQKWCMAAALVLVIAGGVMAIRAVAHMTDAWKLKTGIQKDQAEIQSLGSQLAELAKLKKEAQARINAILPLVPVANARVSWAPKLAALAAAFPPSASLLTVRGSQADLYAGLLAAHPTAQAPTGEVKINFAVMYVRGAAGEQAPTVFVKNLQKSDSFMQQVDRVGLDSLEQQSWKNKSVMVLNGSAEGARVH